MGLHQTSPLTFSSSLPPSPPTRGILSRSLESTRLSSWSGLRNTTTKHASGGNPVTMGAPVPLAASSHGIAAMPAHDTDPNPPHFVHRETKGKRHLWYCLKVIQQPERARACGSGPKSSADRRPVDPPPVVELRIYEGETWERAQNKDITFHYNANFFLFATLEHARVMAHGRVQTPAANSPPILTGMPVSGMAYLDRPQEAGYFLFPDLSVRHEGRYRLTFNLYEETKEDEDKDVNSTDAPPMPEMSTANGGSFDFRMEVKSQDFVVYSAKKFPGLTESTALSRVVAEQGCRVRIRRDVRMRRRDGKQGGDFDNAEADFERRPRRTSTPDQRAADPYRERSMSGSDRTPYSAVPPQRVPSNADYSPQYQTAPPPQGGHLQFLGPSQSYPSQPAYPPPPPSYPQERPTQAYVPINPSPRRDSIHEHRSSVGSVQLPPLSLSSHQPYHQGPPPLSTKPQSLPPIQTSSISSHLPMPMPSPVSGHRPSTLSGPPSSGLSRQYAGTKRAHDETFREAEPTRFQDGARDQGLGEDNTLAPMVYKRSDGRVVEVPLYPKV